MSSFDHHSQANFSKPPAAYAKTRKPRKIVTVRGRGPRGHLPSWKAASKLQYASLTERCVIGALEVASYVTELATQPEVLEFEVEGKRHRYTPDVAATIRGKKYYIEIKTIGFHKSERQVARLRFIINRMRTENRPFLLILSEEVLEGGLHDRIVKLLRQRPCPGPYRPNLDASLWDPLRRTTYLPDLIEQWLSAQRQCDALLDRIIGRDPDALLSFAK